MENLNNNFLYETWDDHWENEEKLTIPGRIMTSVRLNAIREMISSVDIGSAIDVGCGLGFQLQIFKDAGLDYTGIDVSPKSVAVCQRKGLNAQIGKLEEVEGRYDLVAAEGMLEHFLHFEPYVKHMLRISKRYVLLMQPNHDSLTGRTLVYLARLIRGNKIVFEYNYRMKDYISTFENNGCITRKNDPIFFDTSRLLLFEKA